MDDQPKPPLSQSEWTGREVKALAKRVAKALDALDPSDSVLICVRQAHCGGGISISVANPLGGDGPDLLNGCKAAAAEHLIQEF